MFMHNAIIIDKEHSDAIRELMTMEEVDNAEQCTIAAINIIRDFVPGTPVVGYNQNVLEPFHYTLHCGFDIPSEVIGGFGSSRLDESDELLPKELRDKPHTNEITCSLYTPKERVEFSFSGDRMKMLILRYKIDENPYYIYGSAQYDRLVVEEAVFCEGKTSDLASMEFSFYGKDTLEYVRTEHSDKYVKPEPKKVEGCKEDLDFGIFVYTGHFREFVEPDRVVQIDLTADHPLCAISDVLGEINDNKKI